jgi:hypothetical protein
VKHDKLQPLSKNDVQEALASHDSAAAAEALIRMALSEPEWQWAEAVCLNALQDHRKEVKAAALIGIGHLARIHRVLHLDLVLPSLKQLLADPEWAGRAEDILDDIAVFVPVPYS